MWHLDIAQQWKAFKVQKGFIFKRNGHWSVAFKGKDNSRAWRLDLCLRSKSLSLTLGGQHNIKATKRLRLQRVCKCKWCSGILQTQHGLDSQPQLRSASDLLILHLKKQFVFICLFGIILANVWVRVLAYWTSWSWGVRARLLKADWKANTLKVSMADSKRILFLCQCNSPHEWQEQYVLLWSTHAGWWANYCHHQQAVNMQWVITLLGSLLWWAIDAIVFPALPRSPINYPSKQNTAQSTAIALVPIDSFPFWDTFPQLLWQQKHSKRNLCQYFGHNSEKGFGQ